ncbi:hypothetical protein RRG08_025039 [Elysia crispata]|uniref:Uncharacterized protein n=1 Tax=Elysia crispata TaxID=231223 RepID=A0AAE1AP60_9GAST|nr:hypothetical protein RRG08_025039 [Elysia crispata]
MIEPGIDISCPIKLLHTSKQSVAAGTPQTFPILCQLVGNGFFISFLERKRGARCALVIRGCRAGSRDSPHHSHFTEPAHSVRDTGQILTLSITTAALGEFQLSLFRGHNSWKSHLDLWQVSMSSS